MINLWSWFNDIQCLSSVFIVNRSLLSPWIISAIGKLWLTRLTSILAGHRVKTSRLGIIQWFSIALACRRFPWFFFRQKIWEFFEDWNDWRSINCCVICVTHVETRSAAGWSQNEPKSPWMELQAVLRPRSRKSADGMMFGGSIKSFRSVLAAGGTSFKLWGHRMGVCYVLFSISKCGLRIAKCVLSRSGRPLMP